MSRPGPAHSASSQSSILKFFQAKRPETTTAACNTLGSKVARPQTLRERLRLTTERSKRALGQCFRHVPQTNERPVPDVHLSATTMARRAQKMREQKRTTLRLRLYEPWLWWENIYHFAPGNYYRMRCAEDAPVCSVCDNWNYSCDEVLALPNKTCKKCRAMTPQQQERMKQMSTQYYARKKAMAGRTRLLSKEDVLAADLMCPLAATFS